MSPDEFFHCGKVLKTSGSSGELIISFDTEDISKFKKLESVFILLQGNLVPFFIDHIEFKARNQAIVKLLDIESIEDTNLLAGSKLFLPNTFKPRKKRRTAYDFDLDGYTVVDRVHGEIGIVAGILELPMQELLQVMNGGKEILIPLVDEIVLSADHKKRILEIDAPEGLIEIYN
jgi:16S rRNA processing protein RimM